MAILHGSWLQPHDRTSSPSSTQNAVSPENCEIHGLESGCFFIWGETWRRVDREDSIAADALLPHPFAMQAIELEDFLRSLHQTQQLRWSVLDTPDFQPSKRWQTVTWQLPTDSLTAESTTVRLPQHSASADSPLAEEQSPDRSLYSWQIGGFWLTAAEAIQLLHALPLGIHSAAETLLGADLRFWSHTARWSLDLLARSKFLPELAWLNQEGVARWQVVLDSATDQERLARFVRHMPSVCCAYWLSPDREAVPINPTMLLMGFLQSMVDTQIRQAIADRPLPAIQFPKEIPLREWLQALRQSGNSQSAVPIAAASENLEELSTLLNTWLAPIQHQLTQQTAAFRTCFVLQTPREANQHWTLDYCLQATTNPDFYISADVIWEHPVDRLSQQGYVIDQPQETLLAGLGLASRLYPVIESSLHVRQPSRCQLEPKQVYEFLKVIAWRLQENGLGVVLPPSLANQQSWANRLGLSVRLEPPKTGKNQRLGLQSLLNFKWELSIGGQRLSKAEFDRLVALNTPLVEINGEWVELRPQDIKAAQAFFESRKDQRSLSLEDALRISTGDTQMIEKLPVVNFEASGALEELLTTLATGNQGIELLPPPAQFRGELRPYQVRGMSWLAFLERWGLGACLADDMGLGKTIQLIALLLYLKEQNTLEKPTLLVCPTSVLGNWEREVKRFAPSLKLIVHHGEKRAQGKAFAPAVKGIDLVITSYTLTFRDAKTLQPIAWQGIVLDEAQNIKNSQAKQSQAVRELDAEFRIAMTGTPVENRLSELWSIMDFLNPGYLGPRNFFQRRFAVPIERYGDTASLQSLRSLVQPFILRRLKTDRTIIQDLPEKQEMTVFCGLSLEQGAIYQQMVEQSLAEIDSAEGIQRRGMILALITKLKQVCNHPVLLKSEGKTKEGKTKKVTAKAAAEATLQHQSGKLQRLQAMVEEVLSEGDRALIFTQFAEWGKYLQAYLVEQFQQEVLFLYGSTSKQQREEMVDRFQNDPQGPKLFILSLKAGGVGLNLTRANHVFHFDRWWNPAVENQATDRVFRIGQTRNVQVHKFVCTGTLEERIHEIIESKKALSEQIVGTGENWLTEMDTEQLRNLLLLDRDAIITEE